MSKLVWDAAGERLYETGVSNAALYVMNLGTYGEGVAWNGLTKVTESPSGGEPTKLYANNGTYVQLMSNEDFGATIEAFTYPEEFEACDGSVEIAKGVSAGQQSRKVFGLAYKTLIGNDTDGDSYGYKLHIVYGCLAKPSSKDRSTKNDSSEALTMSWELSTTPVTVAGMKPTSHIVIDSTKADATKLAALEKKLYGDADTQAELPTPDELVTLMGVGA